MPGRRTMKVRYPHFWQLARFTPRVRTLSRGFTLVELAIVCALAGILLTVSWPSLRPAVARSSRGDAVLALIQVQQAQARHLAAHGLYAHELSGLGGGAASGVSPQGLYAVRLDSSHADGYLASATARPGSPASADTACARLTVSVTRGFASLGPSTRCWQP